MHDPAGELVHDQHLAVLHQVVHVLLVERVRLQQLVDDVQLLALERVLGLDLPPPGDAIVGRQLGVLVELVDRLRDIGHDEEGRIAR